MIESKFTHEEMQPLKIEYGENLSMTDISERLRGLVPHYEDPSDYTEDDLLIYQGANLIEAYKDEIDRLRNTLDQTRRFALSGEMDKIASDEIKRLRNLYKETCEEKNKEIFEWIEHSRQLVLNSLPWQEENAQLRAILRWVVDTDPTVLRTADVHTDCKCHRCAMDAARGVLKRGFREKK